jgi:hypothetical protein
MQYGREKQHEEDTCNIVRDRNPGKRAPTRPLGVRKERATSCHEEDTCRHVCVPAGHKAKRRVRVWCSLPILGARARRQRYAISVYVM